MGPKLTRLLELIARYRLDERHPQLRTIRRLCELGDFDDEDFAEAQLIALQPLTEAQERRWNGLNRVPTADELYSGGPPIVIGRCAEDETIPIGLFPRGAFHGIVAGTTGAGKTVALRRLVMAIEELNQSRDRPLSLLVLDYKGHDFADLPSRFGPHWRHYDVHSTLRLGLQPPAGVPPHVWINHLATSFSARAGLISAWVTLANLLRWLVAAMNATPSDQLLFPDFRLLLDTLKELPAGAFASKAQYRESLIQALEGAVQASGELFHTFDGLDLERDLISGGLSAVFSLPNVSPPWLNHFIADLFIYQLLLGRIARQQRGDALEVVLIIDEADAIVSRDSQRLFLGSMPPIVEGLRKLREFAVGVWLGLGSPTHVHELVLNSVSHHFVFRLPDDDAVNVARKTLQLPPHSEGIIAALEPGECLARLPGPWPHAMLAKIDFVEPNRGVQTHYDANPHIPAKRLADVPALLEAVAQLKGEHKQGAQRRAREQHTKMREGARKLMVAAAERPYWPVVQLYKLWDKMPSFDVQKAIRRELDENGYATFTEVRVGRRNLLLIELTETAWSFLGKPPISIRGRGGLAHRCFANWLAMLGERRGFESIVEWVVPGTQHPCDVAWRLDDRQWAAFEVVDTCSANLRGHLSAAFLTPGSPVATLTIVAAQRKMLEALRIQVAAYEESEPFNDRMAYLSVEEILMELWE